MKVLVTGAGGFIGGHLVRHLRKNGHWVRGADIKKHEFRTEEANEFCYADLRSPECCHSVCKDMDWVFNLAADMGGIGYITGNHRRILINNIKINMHMLEAAHANYVDRYLFSSSACVYPQHLQKSEKVVALKEDDAYPADAEPGYGWEKLFAELMNQYFWQDTGLKTYIARFHNIYGPYGTYDGGKEKAPAAICRKIAQVQDEGEIEIWGDGNQTRSFCYIDDCVEALYRLIQTDFHEPLNIGYDKLISINELVALVADVSGKKIHTRHNLLAPQGVRGRNSDNTLAHRVLKWQPQIDYKEGLSATYKWISGKIEGTGTIS